MRFLKSAIYVGFLGVAAHFVGEALDRDRFNENAYPFACRVWEREGRIWRRLGVHRWKDKMPDMSKLLPDMFPKRLTEAKNADMVRRLIKETMVAEFIHNCLSILFFIGIWLLHGCTVEGACLGLFAVVCNLPYVIIQRYNRPMLIRYLRRLEARQTAEAETAEAEKETTRA